MSSVYGAITFLVCCSRCWQNTPTKPCPVFMVLSPFLFAVLGAGRTPRQTHVQCLWCYHLSCLLFLVLAEHPDKTMSSVYGAITFLVCYSRCWQNTLTKPCRVFMVLSPFLFAILGAGRTPRQTHVQCLWCYSFVKAFW